MLLVWWCAGPLMLFSMSSVTPMQVFVDRYLSYLGLALVLLLTYTGYTIFGSRTEVHLGIACGAADNGKSSKPGDCPAAWCT